jgi:hypothetical protein
MPSHLDPCLTEASISLDKVRSSLLQAVVDKISAPLFIKERGALAISFSYVWICSILELYIYEFVKANLLKIQGENLQLKEVKTSLFSLLIHHKLDSMSDLSGLKMLNARTEVFSDLFSTDLCGFDITKKLFEGKTIRKTHLITLWKIFGFSNSHLPTPRHGFALEDFADGRNNIAHGEIDPISFGRSKNASDTLKNLVFVEEIILHLHNVGDDYIIKRYYLR